ncbi:LysR family transcriptional regulator [Amphritea sp. HPY]|uniref:LysR family transcriptional regulator n=1 Tax=Amphritea sp. HPY TaxID=3421652 RepID=UPI003D7D3848
MNWNDLKYFLALYREGSLNGAAAKLKVNSTTVARRIQQLELDLGCRLFHRQNGRYILSDDSTEVLQVATELERQFSMLDQRLGGRDQALSGSLRVTSVSTFINGYLLSRIGGFQRRYPNIQLELIADASQLSLTRREADIAIRMGRPESGNLVISKLIDIAYAVYDKPGAGDDRPLKDRQWVCLDEQYADLAEARWVAKHFKNVSTVLRTNIGLGSVEAVRQGVGIAYLPCFLANSYGLTQLSQPQALRELWLLQHPQLTQMARSRAFIEWLGSQLAADRELFAAG